MQEKAGDAFVFENMMLVPACSFLIYVYSAFYNAC